MKKFLAIILAAMMLLSVAACAKNEPAADETPADDAVVEEEVEEGKVLNIYVWNEEFKGFFEKYYESKLPSDMTVNFVINPNEGLNYQNKLDEALLAQADAADDDKVDMFLAEADYIQKYVDSDFSMDVSADIDMSNTYKYTVQACTDTRNGEIKGVSFQCCPSALIYRKSLAEEFWGTSDPAEIQSKLDTWEKFEAEAAAAKEAGYYMTAAYNETLRVFSNNCTSAWVDENNNLTIPKEMEAWVEQTKTFVENEYTLTCGVWDDPKNVQMFADGKTLCFFGPAWYFNFCMGNTQDPEKGTQKDWLICKGPQAHFWGGTWLLAATGTDNYNTVIDIMDAFINDEDLISDLVAVEGQYPNNTKVVDKFANDASYVNTVGVLDEINDIAIFADMTDSIVWENHTIYDQLFAEKFPSEMLAYFQGTITEEEALANFYKDVNEAFPEIVTP